jgi:hypothetical protein
MHNSLVDLLSANQPTTSGGRIVGRSDSTVCLVRNDTGAALPLFGVVGLGDPLITPTENLNAFLGQFQFEGVLAESADYGNKWGLTLMPIADGATGLVRLSGLCHCFLDMVAEFAGPTTDGEVDYLTEADCGARVLWRAAGSGAQRAIIVL